MTHKKDTTDLTELLLKCMAQPDPMLSMLEWLCTRLMGSRGLRYRWRRKECTQSIPP
jgi:hypothetical protein